MKGTIFALLISLAFLSATAQNINIKLFSKYQFDGFTFTVKHGKYQIVSNDKIIKRLGPSDSINIYIKKDKIRLGAEEPEKKWGLFASIIENALKGHKHLQIRGVGSENHFELAPDAKDIAPRAYDDDIQVSNDSGVFKIINDVNFEKYIGAVVECEGGPSSHTEYYKSQAILCRTYAMRHFNKHMDEGYSLCDDVHCQAYKHRCFYNRSIYKSAIETAGLVIVDSKLKLISATFYSNSGGQTANSEDVWSSALPYLRSQPDPFSKGGRNYRWEKSIPLKDWIKYLESKGATVSTKNFSFSQPERKTAYEYGGVSIPTKVLRRDWGLKSAFFDITSSKKTIVFKGKGYGHGVGMAQEGAMNMAEQGYNYEQIIKQYYQGVNIMSMKALDFFQVE